MVVVVTMVVGLVTVGVPPTSRAMDKQRQKRNKNKQKIYTLPEPCLTMSDGRRGCDKEWQ